MSSVFKIVTLVIITAVSQLTVCVCVYVRLHEQMRLMTFNQWFDLLMDIFEHFILFVKRIKVTQLSLESNRNTMGTKIIKT